MSRDDPELECEARDFRSEALEIEFPVDIRGRRGLAVGSDIVFGDQRSAKEVVCRGESRCKILREVLWLALEARGAKSAKKKRV